MVLHHPAQIKLNNKFASLGKRDRAPRRQCHHLISRTQDQRYIRIGKGEMSVGFAGSSGF